MNVENRKAIIGLSTGIILFWLIKKFMLAKSDEIQIHQPEINDSDIEVAITAYKDAQNANEPQSVLNDLNSEFAEQYGFRIYMRKKDGRYTVTDLSGKEVKVI